MDGNGRWAQGNGLPRVEGHRRGIDTVEEITEACRNIGVKYLTLYAFSDENWERPIEEIKALMGLLVEFLKKKRQKLVDNQIKFRVIGDRDRLPDAVQSAISDVEEATKDQNGMTLLVALSYGSKTEICRAVQRAISMGVKDITPEVVSEHLDTAGIPDPDLLIRTSGERRISNFLLWQTAYSEFYFTGRLWPDFKRGDLEEALLDYRRRERRFGKTSEQL
jgi:undecaprenyl diphosphate synthase